jgi:hypothetical protein
MAIDMNRNLKDARLEWLLAEYQSVREEKVSRILAQVKLAQALVVGIVGAYAWMIETNSWTILPVVGLFSSIVALFWSERQRVIQLLRTYIRDEIEKNIVGEYFQSDDPGYSFNIGWQNYFHKMWHGTSAVIIYVTFIFLFGVGILPAIVFSLVVCFGAADHLNNIPGCEAAFSFWHDSAIGQTMCVITLVSTLLFSLLALLVAFKYRLQIKSRI